MEWEEQGTGEVCSAGGLGEENHRKEGERGRKKEKEGSKKITVRERPNQGSVEANVSCERWKTSLMRVVPESEHVACDSLGAVHSFIHFLFDLFLKKARVELL